MCLIDKEREILCDKKSNYSSSTISPLRGACISTSVNSFAKFHLQIINQRIKFVSFVVVLSELDGECCI